MSELKQILLAAIGSLRLEDLRSLHLSFGHLIRLNLLPELVAAFGTFDLSNRCVEERAYLLQLAGRILEEEEDQAASIRSGAEEFRARLIAYGNERIHSDELDQIFAEALVFVSDGEFKAYLALEVQQLDLARRELLAKKLYEGGPQLPSGHTDRARMLYNRIINLSITYLPTRWSAACFNEIQFLAVQMTDRPPALTDFLLSKMENWDYSQISPSHREELIDLCRDLAQAYYVTHKDLPRSLRFKAIGNRLAE